MSLYHCSAIQAEVRGDIRKWNKEFDKKRCYFISKVDFYALSVNDFYCRNSLRTDLLKWIETLLRKCVLWVCRSVPLWWFYLKWDCLIYNGHLILFEFADVTGFCLRTFVNQLDGDLWGRRCPTNYRCKVRSFVRSF